MNDNAQWFNHKGAPVPSFVAKILDQRLAEKKLRQAAALSMVAFLLALTGCDTNAGRDFKQAKAAYVECVGARGAQACEGQRNVMDATSNVYAASSIRR